MFHFLMSLTQKGNSVQGQFYFLTSLKPIINIAQGDLFHFYTSLKQKRTMLETWFHFYARLKPKGKIFLKQPISFFQQDWHRIRTMLRNGFIFTRAWNQKVNYAWGQFYFLTSLKLEINYAQGHLFHFLMSLT